jgi:hypothetical protein
MHKSLIINRGILRLMGRRLGVEARAVTGSHISNTNLGFRYVRENNFTKW